MLYAAYGVIQTTTIKHGIAPNVRRFMTFAAAKRIGAVLAERSVLAEREQEP